MFPRALAAFLFLLVSLAAPSFAAPVDTRALERCAAIADDRERLRCFDALAAEAKQGTAAPEPQEPWKFNGSRSGTPSASPMSNRWELDPADKTGLFAFRAHKQNYLLLGRWSDDPNNTPGTPTQPTVEAPDGTLDNVEAKFQLSFKVKALEDVFGSDADLWFGYTQQSQWQVYNRSISRPFRETDYEPELMLTVPTNLEALGFRLRMVNFGLVHQSNGRSDPLSRSWNRVYAQFGVERGNFGLLIRPWYRLKEDETKDDNPDITDYYGPGDLLAVYKWKRQTFSVLGRYNFMGGDKARGAVQLDWSFPLVSQLRGYVQVFSGYGESLIDYNHRQNTIGIGVLLTDWM